MLYCQGHSLQCCVSRAVNAVIPLFLIHENSKLASSESGMIAIHTNGLKYMLTKLMLAHTLPKLG